MKLSEWIRENDIPNNRILEVLEYYESIKPLEFNNPDDVVTIGKSIDCSLQMSWDIKGQVAPINAELRMVGDDIRLTAVEDGVRVGDEPLPAGRSVSLYHNTQFSIGDTTFTYVERDI